MPVTRLNELDALRGLMLVLMTLTHLPTRLSSPLGQPFGYVSAAEGFVLLSAYMAGLVYGRTAQKHGIDAMASAFWRRAFKVYACHVAILLFLFTVIAFVGLKVEQDAVKNLMSFYLDQPGAAFLTGTTLLYKPPLLDILPMYVLFMLASPWLMGYGLRRGWGGVMALSIGLWVLAQFGLGQWVYDWTIGAVGGRLPFNETGSFAVFAWQFLWVMLHHQVLGKEVAGGQRRAAKTSVDDDRLLAEVLRQIAPQPNRRAADEENTALRGTPQLVSRSEALKVGAPGGKSRVDGRTRAARRCRRCLRDRPIQKGVAIRSRCQFSLRARCAKRHQRCQPQPASNARHTQRSGAGIGMKKARHGHRADQ